MHQKLTFLLFICVSLSCMSSTDLNSPTISTERQGVNQNNENNKNNGSSKQPVDFVFLFDGSRSMSTDDFAKNKDFILDMMANLQNTSIQFAAVQFSREPRTVFTFNDYLNGDAKTLLKNEAHMKSLTNTHQALRFVMKEHFENSLNGASPEATKVLVLITDGDPSDENRGDIEAYDSKNIIRLVIGVKMDDLSKVMNISSAPKEDNTFPVENYDGLTGLLQIFEERIIQIEGVKP